MARAEAYRPLVEARAGGACEYCRLLHAATGITFHIEHVVPRSRGGQTVMSNLGLSCPGCNLAKAEKTTGEDQNDRTRPFFNPRHFEPWFILSTIDGDDFLAAPLHPTHLRSGSLQADGGVSGSECAV